MTDLLIVIGVAAVLFASTNIDDIFVLVTFFADPAYRSRQVVVGQFLGMGALIALSVVGSLLALVVPGEYVGLLGVLPFALGVVKLVKMRGRGSEASTKARSGSRVLAVAVTTFANGGDNLGAYVPVFATQTPVALTTMIAVFLALTVVWCAIGYALVNHPNAGPAVRQIARPVTPFVLIAIGVLIVIESGAYRLVLG